MKLPQFQKRRIPYLALAFAIPAGAIVLLMLIAGYVPFGYRSMLYSDMWHQYFPFFKEFRRALLSGDSLLYNWSVGMGMDYLGLISYYLASPLNLLTVLIPESWMLSYFSLLVPIKLGLASLFFAIFLKKTFGKNDMSLPLFGAFYGLCAWALGYQWNVMWLDTFALLPLVAMGAVSLMKERKFILYTVTLFLSIFANYYIGFFTCIFVFLLFVCYQICCCKSIKHFFLDLGHMALFSLLAIGMTAILELPALAALQNTQSSVNSFPDSFSLNMVDYNLCAGAREAWNAYKAAKTAGEPSFLLMLTAIKSSFPPIMEGMRKVAGNMPGGIAPTFKEGLPNLYCGVGTIFFAFLFLTSHKVKLREKLCSLFLLVFFMLSFVIRQLDYVWHGFHFTNMIPYRFSFLFSFVLLYMAYKAYIHRNHIQIWQLVVAGMLSFCIFLYSDIIPTVPAALDSLGLLAGNFFKAVAASLVRNQSAAASAWNVVDSTYKAHRPAYSYLGFNALFFGIYFGSMLYSRILHPFKADAQEDHQQELRNLCLKRRHRRAVAANVITTAMVAELILTVCNFGISFPYTDIRTYPRGTEQAASMIRYMKQRNNPLFYRAEATHTQTLNDGALNDYNGISTFTSSANVRVTEFMKGLGYSAKNTYNRYSFEESSPVSNLFLNLKYMLERQGLVEENPYFDDVHHYGKVHLLENNAYLPLGFLAQPQLENVDFSGNSTAFIFQNELFSAATGLYEEVWHMTDPACLTIEPQNVTIENSSSGGYCAYTAGPSGGQLCYRYTITEEGFFCVDLTMPSRNNFTVYRNDMVAPLYSESISLPQTLSVSQVVPGDVIEIRVSCRTNENSSVHIKAGILDEEVFRRGYEILAASTLALDSFSNTEITGSISCDRDGLLYTSIPQDGNWQVKVDGKDAEIVLVGNAMCAVRLEEGNHDIVFRYKNKAFSIGWKVSLVSALIFAGFILLDYYRKHQKMPWQK